MKMLISSEAPAQAPAGTADDCNCSNKKNQRNQHNQSIRVTHRVLPQLLPSPRSGARKNFRRDRADLSLLPPEHLGHGALGGEPHRFHGLLDRCRRRFGADYRYCCSEALRNQTWEKIQIHEDSPFRFFFSLFNFPLHDNFIYT